MREERKDYLQRVICQASFSFCVLGWENLNVNADREESSREEDDKIYEKPSWDAGAPGNAGSIPRSGRFPWRRKWQPTPHILSWEIPWTEEPGRLQSRGHKESDTTEWLSTKHTHSFIRLSWVFVASGLSLMAESEGYSWVVVHRLLLAVTLLVAKDRL